LEIWQVGGFQSETEPQRGLPLPVIDGVRRIVAANPGPMTYHGTNTWLLDEPDGTVVIDPGPDDAAHVAAILDATGSQVVRILLTHTHPDHLGATAALQAATGAPVAAWPRPWFHGFTPTPGIADGEQVGGLTALYTPGHASDHLCFARHDGVLFTGDHVMSWSTSIVSPPDGDMAAYMASLRRLLARDDRLYLCGHGPPLPDPAPLVRGMLAHRIAREAAILRALEVGPRTEAGLVTALYTGLAPHLVPAAQRSVLAHLLKLETEAIAHREDGVWRLMTAGRI
jgi:glyoxylase-like metal-dependent hydrolase (beta-lactamase superfamily II)